jgi:hypothetical protein
MDTKNELLKLIDFLNQKTFSNVPFNIADAQKRFRMNKLIQESSVQFPDKVNGFYKMVVNNSKVQYRQFVGGKKHDYFRYNLADIPERFILDYEEITTNYKCTSRDALMIDFHSLANFSREGARWCEVLKLKEANLYVCEALMQVKKKLRMSRVSAAEVYIELLRNRKFLHLKDFATIFFDYEGGYLVSDVAVAFCMEQCAERLSQENEYDEILLLSQNQGCTKPRTKHPRLLKFAFRSGIKSPKESPRQTCAACTTRNRECILCLE